MTDASHPASNARLPFLRRMAEDGMQFCIEAEELLALVECAEIVFAMPCICHLCNGKCNRCKLQDRLS